MRWLGGLVGRRAGRVGEMVDWKAVIAVVERDKGGVGAGLGEFKTFPEGACIFVGGWGHFAQRHSEFQRQCVWG